MPTLQQRLAEGLPHRNHLRRLVWNLLSSSPSARDEVEDVLQDTWVRAMEAVNAGTEVTNERAWLSQLARNVAYTRLRKERGERSEPLDDDMVSRDPAPDSDIRGREAIRAVLANLSPRQAVVLRRRLKGDTKEEIAADLGLAVGTVGSHLARARRALCTAGLEVRV